MSKAEHKEIELMLEHAQRDIEYGASGSYGDGEKVNQRKQEKALRGIRYVRWILEAYYN